MLTPPLGVYLGTRHAGSDRETLVELGVSRIVNVGGGPCHFRDFEYLEVRVPDVCGANLMTELDEATSFVQRSVVAGVPVLCHCVGAISRSPTVVLAYLLRFRELSYSEALEAVRIQRPLAHPNITFVKQLKAYGHKWTSSACGDEQL